MTTSCVALYLLEHLPVALSLVLLTDHLPRPKTVSVWKPQGCVLKHLIQSVHSWVQRRHQLLDSAHCSVGSLGMSQYGVCLRSPGSFLLWAVKGPFRSVEPAEDGGGQEGDDGVDPHHEVEEEQQDGVQVLLELHLDEAVKTQEGSSGRVSRKICSEKRSGSCGCCLSVLFLFLLPFREPCSHSVAKGPDYT